MAPEPGGTPRRKRQVPWGTIAGIEAVAIVALVLAYCLGLVPPLHSGAPSAARGPVPAASPHRSSTPAAGPKLNSLNIAANTADVLSGDLLGTAPKSMDIRFDADLLRFTYPNFNLAGSDFASALNRAAAMGHGVLAIADDYAPSQIAEDHKINCQQTLCALSDTTAAANAYAKFAVNVGIDCMSVHPHCVAEELGNEPNVGAMWGPKPNPAAYARAVSVACPAIKAATHGALAVVLGGLANMTDDSTDYTPATFYSAVVQWFNARHLARCWDAVGIHPYGDTNLAVTDSLYAAMKHFGDGGKKIWATEVGTGGSPTAANAYFTAFVKQWFAQAYAGPLFWFSWQTDTGQTGIDSSPAFLTSFKLAVSHYGSR